MKDSIIDSICITLSTIFTITQTNEVFKTISLILTILSVLVVLARNIYDWYLKAKQDKMIDKEEIKELIDIVSNSVDELDKIKKSKD